MAFITPILATVLVLVIAVAAMYFRHRQRELIHQEKMAAIEKNLPLPESFFQEGSPVGTSQAYLLRGLIWLFVGIGVAVLLVAIWFTDKDPENLSAAALGLIPAGVGVAYLIVYRKAKRKEDEAADRESLRGSGTGAVV